MDPTPSPTSASSVWTTASPSSGVASRRSPAVKAVAPDLPVLAGSTSFVDVPFLQQMWADGAVGFFDGISVHPYNEWRAPGAPHAPVP